MQLEKTKKWMNQSAQATLLAVTLGLTACGCGGDSAAPEPTIWSAQAYIKASNASASPYFGWSVALDSDTAVVGARLENTNSTTINGSTPLSDNGAPRSGAAYVFKRTGNNWVQEAFLKAPNVHAGDDFGNSVSISGDTIIVGADAENSNQTTITTSASSNQSAGSSGAAYIFKRTGTTWALEAYLKAPNALAHDNFGSSVSIDGDTAVVGAYAESSTETSITNGPSVTTSISAQTYLSGAAYVFKRTGSTWVHEAYLKASNANQGDQFGYSVSVSGDTVAVGAYGESSDQTTITNGIITVSDSNNQSQPASFSGAAYVFKRTGAIWLQEAYLKAPNTAANALFGASVALNGDSLVVGAPGENSN